MVASIANSRVTDFVIADYSVFLADHLKVMVLVLEELHEEVKLLKLQTSRALTKIQVSGGLLKDKEQFVLACSEHIEILENIIYLFSVVQNSGGLGIEVLRRIRLTYAFMNSLYTSINICTRYQYLCRTNKRIFKPVVLPALLYSYKT